MVHANRTYFAEVLGVAADQAGLNVTEQVETLDRTIFDQVHKHGRPIVYGEMYLLELLGSKESAKGTASYAAVLLLNSTAQAVAGSWGAYAHTAFLR